MHILLYWWDVMLKVLNFIIKMYEFAALLPEA